MQVSKEWASVASSLLVIYTGTKLSGLVSQYVVHWPRMTLKFHVKHVWYLNTMSMIYGTFYTKLLMGIRGSDKTETCKCDRCHHKHTLYKCYGIFYCNNSEHKLVHVLQEQQQQNYCFNSQHNSHHQDIYFMNSKFWMWSTEGLSQHIHVSKCFALLLRSKCLIVDGS